MIKRRYVAGCALGCFIFLAGCSDTPAPPADTSVADLKTIKDGEVAWTSDWNSKDVDKIVSHYADDANVLMPDQPILKGRSAIRTALQSMLLDKNLALNFTNTSAVVSKSGDLGYTEGTYNLTTTNPRTKRAETEIGKYVTVYKKQADGSWKAVEDVINADAPAAPVAMAASKKAAPPAVHKKKKK